MNDLARPGWKLPDAYVILLGIALLAMAATWVVPAGQYHFAVNPVTGMNQADPNSFSLVERQPVMPWTFFLYFPIGLEKASEVLFMVLLVGGFLQIINDSGAIASGLSRLIGALGSRQMLILPLLMTCMSLLGFSGILANAVVAFIPLGLLLARWILELDGLTDYAAGTTLNMGLISGGEAKNAVPARAQGTLDVRFSDPDVPARVEQRMLELSSTARPGLAAHWEQVSLRPPMNPSPETRALCDTARAVADREAIANVAFVETGGASDANLAAAEGAVCLDGLGPAGGKLHSPDEYLLLDTVEPRIRFVYNLILSLMGNTGAV